MLRPSLARAYNLHLPPCQGSTRRCGHHPNCLQKQRLCGGKGIWKKPPDSVAAAKKALAKMQRGDVPVGLLNLGATCYISSLLQSLFMDHTFRQGIYAFQVLSSEFSADAAIVLGLQRLFAHLQCSVRPAVSPAHFIRLIKVAASEQQDLHEFNKLLLTHLESRLALSSEAWVRTLVQDQVRGQYLFVTECQQCRYRSCSTNHFYELSLPLSKSLRDSFDAYTQVEHLSGDDKYDCSKCESKQLATRQSLLTWPPQVLNVQLIRFVFDVKTLRKKKNHSAIEIPLQLDLSDYVVGRHYQVQSLCCSASAASTEVACDRCCLRFRCDVEARLTHCLRCGGDVRPECQHEWVYELYAVLRHYGASAHSGHYVADVRSQETKEWFQFNDDEVKKITLGEGEVSSDEHSVTSKSAYMLVYMRRDRASGTSAPPPVPNYLKDTVSADNSAYIAEMEALVARLNADNSFIAQRKADVNQVLDLVQQQSPSIDGRLVPLHWLQRWIQGDVELRCLQAADFDSVLCSHGRLSALSLSKLKRLPPKAMQLVHDTLDQDEVDEESSSKCFGDVPQALCQECVAGVVDSEKWVHQIERIVSLLTNEAEPVVDGVWIAKKFVKACCGNAKKVLARKTELLESLPACRLSPLQGVVCPHGRLSLGGDRKGRVVASELWTLMKRVGWIEHEVDMLLSDVAECEECFQDQHQAEKQRRDVLDARKTELDALRHSRLSLTVAHGQLSHDPGHYLAVPADWFEAWLVYARSQSVKIRRPLPVPLTKLWCGHRRLCHRIDAAPSPRSKCPVVLLTLSEFETISFSYGVEGEAIEVEVRDDGVVFPPVCEQCCEARERSEKEAAATYKGGSLRVQRLFPGRNGTGRPCKRPRRSQAGQHSHDEILVTLDSDASIHNLKLLVFQEWDFEPGQQTMFFNEEELDEERTLEDYRIPNGGLVKVTISNDDAFVSMNHVDLGGSRGSGRESGFLGSALADW